MNLKTEYGAHGNGHTDDTDAVEHAIIDSAVRGIDLEVPSGTYRLTRRVTLPPLVIGKLSIWGCSPHVSRFLCDGVAGLNLQFRQEPGSARQLGGIHMEGIGMIARGTCGQAIEIGFGNPAVTNEHYRCPVVVRDVSIESDDGFSAFSVGLAIESAWNARVMNLQASGTSAGGNWNAMQGVGLDLRGMCVNTHISNSQLNFWATGLRAHGGPVANHEGIFVSNTSMVAVKRGVWLAGNTAHTSAPRISTLSWQGGMIECRVGGVTGGSAAFHLQNVWTALIGGCQMLAETLDGAPEITYGVVPQDCIGVCVNGCDINAFKHGFESTGDSDAHVVGGNTFTNVPQHITFGDQTKRSRAFYNSVRGGSLVGYDLNPTGGNKIID